MRLTLRTLLAYLDDTLEPMEIKKIGQKVSESEAAQELIARIKQVTRRRRITTPPATGPNAFDPNTVADYLDNELSSEEIAELEKICLESDVHLAEIATCHQILTLVLGEPALVPPTAKERMYGLVQGREAIPFRKAATPGVHAPSPSAADIDADEMFLLGLPFYRRGSWLRWALPVAGVVLLAVVAVALWQSISSLNQATQPAPVKQVADASNPDKPDNTKPDNTKPDNTKPDNTKPDNTKPDNTKPDNTKPDNTDSKKPENTDSKKPDNTDNTKPDNTESKRPASNPVTRKAKPSTERAEVGGYYFDAKSPPSILVQRKNEEDGWHRLKPGTRVSSKDQLMSLPGYASELRLDNGAHLLLRGHVREFSLPLYPHMDYLQESAVVLHKNKDVDVDVTLQRGRLYLSNHKDKGPLVARLRFETEVWDLTLEEPGSEVGMELLKYYDRNSDYSRGEEPVAILYLLVLQGRASLAVEYNQYPNLSRTGAGFFQWDNKGPGAQGPQRVDDQVRGAFAKVPPSNRGAEGMDLALNQISRRMLPDKFPSVALDEALLSSNQPMEHMLAIYCLGALDEVKKLIGVLGDNDPVHAPNRDTAIFTLRRWLARDASQGLKLYDPKNKTGLLQVDREYKESEADTVFLLLHDFNEEDRAKPETYDLLATCLLSEKVAIAELARWHLYRLSSTLGVKLSALDKFNAALPRPEREAAAREVRDKINEGKLPPRTTGRPTGPAPVTPPRNGSGTKPKS